MGEAGPTTQIIEADRELLHLAQENAECRRLMTVPGVGPNTALRFLAAVDDVTRFRHAHQLESYFGLTPGEDSSSDRKQRTSITKAGAKKVRWLLVQAAWCAFRTSSDPMVLWAKKIAERKGNRVAVVGLARKIAGILFAILRDGTTYNASRDATARAETKLPRVAARGRRVLEQARESRLEDTTTETAARDAAPAPVATVRAATRVRAAKPRSSVPEPRRDRSRAKLRNETTSALPKPTASKEPEGAERGRTSSTRRRRVTGRPTQDRA